MRWGRMAASRDVSAQVVTVTFTVSLALKPKVPLIHTYTSEQGELFVYDGMGTQGGVVGEADE